MESMVSGVNKVDPTGSESMSTMLYENINIHPILHYHGTEATKDGKYSTLAAMNPSKGVDFITPK